MGINGPQSLVFKYFVTHRLDFGGVGDENPPAIILVKHEAGIKKPCKNDRRLTSLMDLGSSKMMEEWL